MSDNQPIQPAKTLAVCWRLYKLGMQQRSTWLLMFVGLLVLASVNGLLVWMTHDLLEVFGPIMMSEDLRTLLPEDTRTNLIADMKELASKFFMLVIPASLAAGGSWYLSQVVAQRAMYNIRQHFLSHFIDIDLAFHTRAARGDVLSRMSSDMEATIGVIGAIYGRLQVRPFEAIGIIAFMAWLDWRLALVLCALTVPAIISMIRLFKKTRKRATKARQIQAESVSTFEQITSGIRVIKSLGTKQGELDKFDVINQDLKRNYLKTAKSRSWSDVISYGLTFLAPGVIVLAAIPLVNAEQLSGAVLGTFAASIGRLTTLIRVFQKTWGGLLQQVPASERIFEFMDHQPEIVDADNAIDCPQPKQAIVLKQVSFSYDGAEQRVLQNCDLTIPIGKTVALVGESGAGKSTILDLIARFHDVQQGSICFDETDIRQFRHRSLVSHLSIVQQDNFLFDDSVMANIRYGRNDASDEQVFEAARKAHVHDAILGLEGGDGYQTRVGNRGERLSGGQRQRIAIARALLRDAPILLLDEPTSALDAASEAHVQQALQELMKDRTCIIVAHRLATIQHADIICVLDKTSGQIVESGSHAELVELGGAYAELVQHQQLQ